MNQDELFEWEDSTLDPIQKQLLDWSNEPVPPPEKHDNPCITLYGKGPGDKLCRDCTHLFRDRHHGSTYPKCELRKLTRGPGSDHRVRWPTCGRFVQRIEQDGDLLFESWTKHNPGQFMVSLWKRNWWEYHGLWTLMDLAKACEEQGLILIEHIPEDSIYEGIYRKRSADPKNDPAGGAGTSQDMQEDSKGDA